METIMLPVVRNVDHQSVILELIRQTHQILLNEEPRHLPDVEVLDVVVDDVPGRQL